MAISSTIDDDAFELVTRPPPNESSEERVVRERKESEARRVSNAIDEELRKDRAALKKQARAVRVLLLGQSESGKSTTLKNFRMRFAQEEWRSELASWRTVIYLNLLRSVLTILDALQAELGDADDPPGTPSGDTDSLYAPDSPLPDTEPSQELESPTIAGPAFASQPGTSLAALHSRRPSISSVHRLQAKDSTASLRKDAVTRAGSSPVLTDHHRALVDRLICLRDVEKSLRKILGTSAEDEVADAAATEEYGVLGTSAALTRPPTPTSQQQQQYQNASLGHGPVAPSFRRARPSREFSVRRLKDALTPRSHRRSTSSKASSDPALDEVVERVASARDDMQMLWTDEVVRMVLKRRKVRVEDGAGFFLDDVDRIAARGYVPSDDDVVRARLRTLGVQEYRICVDPPSGMLSLGNAIGGVANDWLLYDVGGSRTLRHAWLPYFENITAIIFLAPVSCFDERLQEDWKINRLEDSMLLWRTVCASKLLFKTSLLLFLNKCDLLKKKLRQGVKVRHYLPSFGDRPNDATTVVKYLKEKFRDIARAQAPEGGRVAYYYATSVTEIKATQTMLGAVKDIIVRDHLKNASII